LATVNAGGTGYIPGDVLTVAGGWAAGSVTAIGANVTLTSGTLSASSGGGGGNWTATAVSAIDASLTVTSGTLSVTALPGVTALGTVAGGTTLGISSGTLQATGGWQNGAVTALAGALSLTSGTLTNTQYGTLTLSGTTTVNIVSGIATFTNLVCTTADTVWTIADGIGNYVFT
jgi:hypothetical protein